MTPSEITNLFTNLTNRLESIKEEIESLEAAILQLQILCKNTKVSEEMQNEGLTPTLKNK